MSRLSDLRDAVVAELQNRIDDVADNRITAFLIPDFDKEDLRQPRIGVRTGDRDIEESQGPAERLARIEVGVMGQASNYAADTSRTGESIRAQQVANCDELDTLLETVLCLWTPDGPLKNVQLAEHVFHEIDQPFSFDPNQLYQHDIWVSIISITYRDLRDI